MEAMKKWVSMLIAFSLAFSALTGSAIAASVTAGVSTDSELIEDPAGDAAALGDTQEEEATASVGIEEDSDEEEDVMATVTGEVSADDDTAAEEEEEAAEGETSAEEETVSAGIKEEEEDPEASGTTDEPEATSGTQTEEEEPEASQPQPGDEEEPEAGWTEESRLPFTDVPVGHWSYEFVLYAYENDLVRGVSATEFNPTGVMTRAAFVTTLYRLSAKLGSDMTEGTAAFTDISDINAEFRSAILWGVAHGIVTGKSAEMFAPRENVTRQQMCAILTRYLRDYLRYDLSGYATENDGFADSDTISSYAKEAVSIMRGMGVIDGRTVDGASVFDPSGSASRAAVVKVLSNAVQMIPDLTALPEQEPEQNGETVTSGDGVSDNAETVASGDSVTDNGDSATDSNSSKSASSGSGKSSGGGSGGSSGGGSGGSSGSSGGSSGSTTPVIVEPENADQIFSYIDEMIASYEANPPTGKTASACMEILIRDMRSIKELRESKTVLVDAEYVKSHYKSDMDQLIEIYQLATTSARLDVATYLRGLTSPSSKLMDVLEYFDLLELLI